MDKIREIKFRAWDKVAKTWFRNGGGFSIDWDASHITDDNDDRTRTNPTIVLMQFTGLKDKSGKEIYEGDVINVGFFALNDTDKFGKECWKNLPAGVDANDISTITDTIKVTFHPKDIYWLYRTINDNPDVVGVEVIGNIYETKTEGIIAEGLIDHGV